MTYIGTYEAKTHLTHLLKKVGKGEVITITKHGQPVAMLVPPSGSIGPDLSTFSKRIKKIRKNNKLAGLSLKKLITQGRK